MLFSTADALTASHTDLCGATFLWRLFRASLREDLCDRKELPPTRTRACQSVAPISCHSYGCLLIVWGLAVVVHIRLQSPDSVLLRRGWRGGGEVKNFFLRRLKAVASNLWVATGCIGGFYVAVRKLDCTPACTCGGKPGPGEGRGRGEKRRKEKEEKYGGKNEFNNK